MAVRSIFKELFGKYLYVTNNALTIGSVLLGDVTVRQMEALVTGKEAKKSDAARTGRLCLFGIVTGTTFHFWYKFLDHMLPGKSARTIVKKIVCDQIVAAPVANSLFLAGISLVEGENWEEIKTQLRTKLLTVILVDCLFWPSAQAVNFYFLPSSYRMAYLNTMTYVWTCFLFYMQHRHVEPVRTSDEKAILPMTPVTTE